MATEIDNLSRLKDLLQDLNHRDRNEADTRHQIIDFIIHDFLAWPKNRVLLEQHIHSGYADYILKKSTNDDLLFIEAKKEGEFFTLPIAHNPAETSCFISIGKLLSDTNIKAAMNQVRKYCLDSGCEFACVTNGHEWIFFKIFEKNKKWESLQAFVIRDLKFFANEYTKAINNFSFTAITELASLPALLASAPPKDRAIFYPREKINSYSHVITANRLATKLRPIVNNYFGVIKDNETEFMERCYVSQREYIGAHDGMRELIHDSLSPYFSGFGVQQLENTGKGGQIGGRLTKNLKNKQKNEVLVLFGGKGAGKSTFIKRLLHHNPPRWLQEHGLIAIVDLLTVPEEITKISLYIWNALIVQLDPEKLLQGDRDVLTKTLFKEKFDIAKRQDLSGLNSQSESYNIKLNELVTTWKNDHHYCCRQLIQQWADKGRGAIIVVDNTDQYVSSVQDFCFTTAQEIASELSCVVLISMREERFYDSKIHGVLDAYQNSGFHISSPKPAEVFKKRLSYTASLLVDDTKRKKYLGDVDAKFISDSTAYLLLLSKQFTNDSSPLNSFLTACAHGDIRLSLDLFRSFLLSGYTNVDEMITAGSWNFQIHQVIKPVMIPERYFYDENVSDIPNIYQIRSTRHGSHFTALRILRKLGNSVDISSPPYLHASQLKTYFAETFNMVDDYEKNMHELLKRGFIESNNRLDSYSEKIDQVKITNYGLYMFNELAYYFTYLDLVCTDCGIFDTTTTNFLSEAARKEYALFLKGERVERVKVRLDRVDEFLKYLGKEEHAERELYSLEMPEEEMFTTKARDGFSLESLRVIKSAQKQPNSRNGHRVIRR